jgi:hypothetical protein
MDVVLGGDGARLADTLIYVFHDNQFADDVEFLTKFAETLDRSTSGSAAAVGVLSHADTFGAGPWGVDDPIAKAAERAAELAVERAGELATVTPLAGRLAEAACAGLLVEADARALALLRDDDELDLQDREASLPVEPAEIDALFGLIGAYGLRHGRTVADGGAAAVRNWMFNISGADRLRTVLGDLYVGRYPQVKAQHAVDALKHAAHGSPHRTLVEQWINEALLTPQMHPLRELDAWERMATSHREHPVRSELGRQLSAASDTEKLGLPGGTDSPDIWQAAVRAAGAAKTQANLTADQTLVFAYGVLHTSFSHVARRAKEIG